MFERGCLHWVRLPGEGKKRPALVVSPTRRNDRASTVVVVPCSIVQRFGPWHVRLDKGEGGLKHESVAKCEDVTTIMKERLDPRPLGGPISSARLDEVRASILRALDFE